MTDENVNTVSGRRRAWRIAGGVLWLCVSLALFGMWMSRRPDHVAAQTEADEEPAKVIRVETGADGTIRFNESHQALKSDEKPKPIWDPNGVEDFSFKNCDGRTIAKQDLLGKPWVACFVFTHCLGPCPLITKRMRELQDRFQDEDFHLVTFTVDPDRDTPEALKTYAELNGADLNRWYFLWGEAVDVYGLIHRSFLMPVRMPTTEGNYQVEHSKNMMLVDAQGVVRGKFTGDNDEDMAALARELRRLLHPPKTSATSVRESSEIPDTIPLDAWYMKLPAVNAGLNGLATLLLGWGYVLIKRGRANTHRNVMLTAFAVSIAFLACYVVYHVALHHYTGLPGKEFAGSGPVRPVYFTILITHVLLAAAVPVLALMSIYRGLKQDWTKHRRISKITWPIWMYVSVTGVIIYGMLYHWPTAG